ncbi:Os06g0277200 [Oryza sativa Japonica Group]|uniref:Os06g0277200 protein n=1 Tax=Oryza sativa subsp. japonica TaxID=39947 RepID=A0A0P0WV64_ORYSJ|nr:Os06g0277200 [Oryza sativa Japonica Group]
MVHGADSSPIAVSINFLVNYEACMLPVRQQIDDKKGKRPMFEELTEKVHASAVQIAKWEPPPEGVAKVNIDAGFRKETGDACAGIIVRDCWGLVLLAACKKLPRCSSATLAEALAFLEGVRLAMNWIHMPIILESDNADVVAGLNITQASRAEWGGIIAEIRVAMQCLLQVQVHKVKRDSNRIAHMLAQMVMTSGVEAEWRLCAPAEILELLNQEYNPMFCH